jgi:Tfp pilus assembly protein PilO
VKELVNKLIGNLHVFMFLWGCWTTYELYEQHDIKMTEIETEIPNVEADIVKLKSKVKEINDFIKKADEYKVRVEEVAKNIEAVQRQLPAETNDSQIISTFSSEMKVLNIKDTTMEPRGEESSTYFISKDYSVKANGTFLQFLIFFERLGNATRIYNVKSLKLSTNGTGPRKGRFQIINGEAVIQAYRFNPQFKVNTNL